ncbi:MULTISPECIES: SDR family NAD(P)-dependent oxidoreductase [unclassified Bradyrhizobium]|uniref:SDR family NAD(P)-dependent oxidoreductase n=1 Tax=unclassified Bradyrhizobium TaxID=2631580 RepID=UPI0028E21D28|nr:MULTISPECIES: SDR family NAD(P)-dependent oxidoreductase [unclassified Bradyrhizobium]
MTERSRSTTIRFDNQVAVVTGAGRGLGAAYAHLLANRGARVVVHDAGVAKDGSGFDPSVADGVARQIVDAGGSAVACHENLEEAIGCKRVIEFTMDTFGRLDVLIHNAGLVIFAPLEETTPQVWNRMVNLGVHAPFHLLQSAIPHMIRQAYGRVVLTTSGRALRVADNVPGLTGYAVGKMAQLGLMVGIAAETRDAGIRINAISPVAATRILRRHAPELKPELVAPGVIFLASPACDASGVVLSAAGGRFSGDQWSRAAGVDFGPEPIAPEMIAARWYDIVQQG